MCHNDRILNITNNYRILNVTNYNVQQTSFSKLVHYQDYTKYKKQTISSTSRPSPTIIYQSVYANHNKQAISNVTKPSYTHVYNMLHVTNKLNKHNKIMIYRAYSNQAILSIAIQLRLKACSQHTKLLHWKRVTSFLAALAMSKAN